MRTSIAVLGVLLVEAAIIFIVAALYGTGTESLQIITRYSGRFSLLLFLTIIVLYPSRADSLKDILSPRYLLAFATAHFVHLCELLTYLYVAGIFPVPYRLAGGFIAYVLIFVAPWTQERYEGKKISEESFSRFMNVYQIYVWLIFLMTYVGRVTTGTPDGGSPEKLHYLLLGFVSTVMVVKLLQIIRKR